VSDSRKPGRRRAAPPSASPPPPSPPTLAAAVRELAPGTSWEQARALCRGGRVWVNGRVATDPAWRPEAGSSVEVRSAAAALAAPANEGPAPTAPPAAGVARELVVYADADLAVVRKPPGVLTVPFDRGDRDTLLALTRVALRRIEARRRSARARPGEAAQPPAVNPTLRAVQRLDKDTSGLLVFARNVAAQRELQLQLARREVTRRYEALVHGTAGDAVYESWLIEDRGDGLRGSWGAWRAPARDRPGAALPASPPPGARHAVTRVRVLEALRGATWIACELETGRQHQIRIHLAEAGHPLVGETVYVRDYRGRLIPAPRPLLHAAVLGFLHPRDGRPLRFEEPPPADFAEVLRRLRQPRR
jgi:23S rRNA pseudouridine1911/1915/1917 synthase